MYDSIKLKKKTTKPTVDLKKRTCKCIAYTVKYITLYIFEQNVSFVW